MIKKRLSNEAPISSVIEEIIQRNNLETGLNEVSVKKAWKDIMGNGVNTYTEAVSYKNKTMIVTFTSSIVRSELSMGKDKIIDMMNEELGKNLIENIIFR